MAVIFLEPAGSGFPGGIAGGGIRANSTDRSQTAWTYLVGTRAKDATGNEYTLVKAGAAISANDAVRFNAGLSDVRKTSAPNQVIEGIADAAFASGDYGWLLTRGQATVACDSDVLINDALGAGYTAGRAARCAGSLFVPKLIALTAASSLTCTGRIR